nr:GAF domain-containing SpoIIE family protein phosphatase [Frankia sp. AiPs1]
MPAALADPRRLAAVAATGLLDTDPETAYDDLAGLAATMTGCGRAFITLVDAHRSFWKSAFGVDARTAAPRQSPVRNSFCYHLIDLAGERFVVEDAAHDPRTHDHPSIGPMKIGAWAGYPILAPAGEVLGSMYVIDENPHSWQPAELAALATLSRAVSNEINLRTSLITAQAALRASETLARSLQDSLLPPVLQTIPGLETAASYLPATGGADVVGDFYDLFHTQGPRWGTVIGDVCGKGVEAAKLTALARYTLRAEATQHPSPAAVCHRLNSALLDQHHGERFLTAAYSTFRTTPAGITGQICLAGHPPALIRRADGRIHPVGEPGTLLGVVDDHDLDLSDVRFRLARGDALLLYTDGATEARARDTGHPDDRPLFGEQALTAALAECHDLTAAGIIDHLGTILAHHSGDWASDDTALLALRVPATP